MPIGSAQLLVRLQPCLARVRPTPPVDIDHGSHLERLSPQPAQAATSADDRFRVRRPTRDNPPNPPIGEARILEYGVHLPLVDLGAGFSLRRLQDCAHAAVALGYRYVCANDHLLFRRPWLDGPTALAAVIRESGDLTLATTVSLPVIRGPVQLAKTLAAIDVLSEGRLLVCVGPGSSERDYASVGLAFDERWRRFDESLGMLRAVLDDNAEPFDGAFYSSRDLVLEPRPSQRPGPRIWVASWGSPPGMRRVARYGDGWLASAYNTTPDRLRAGLDRLADALQQEGKEMVSFPNGLATTWLYVTDDRDEAERMLADVLAPLLGRPLEALRSLSLPIGPAETCAERLAAFASAGVQRVFVWPLRDEVAQLELLVERVAPLVEALSR
jgi:alkanesulfonate monooxygenase SsuD/methylene tetrahydromethanopterin reductase-like flavin-dependent oxidoreductase (luciferase family)